MARVTVEDCIDKVESPYELVLVAKERSTQLNSGIEPTLDRDNDKNTVIALREIAEKRIDLIKTWDAIVKISQRYQPVEDTDIDENETVPMNENASQVSFDNFEKENASEKKRKKIYMTQNEIQKLITQKKDDSQTDNIETGLEDDNAELSTPASDG